MWQRRWRSSAASSAFAAPTSTTSPPRHGFPAPRTLNTWIVKNTQETDSMNKVAGNRAPEDPTNENFDKLSGDIADRVMIEEDDVREIAEEKEKLNDFDYFTGNPLPSDILLYAVPVCGPYNALQMYKYRVKTTPVTAKKGKAAKSAMNLFGHIPEATNREKELMKACTDAELVGGNYWQCEDHGTWSCPVETEAKERIEVGQHILPGPTINGLFFLSRVFVHIFQSLVRTVLTTNGAHTHRR